MDTLFDLISKRVPHEMKKTVSLLKVQTTVESVLGLYPVMNRHINTAAIEAEESSTAQRRLGNLRVEQDKVLIFILEANEFQNKNSIVPAEAKVKILEDYLICQKRELKYENSYENRYKLKKLDYLLKKCKRDQTALKDILNSGSCYHNYDLLSDYDLREAFKSVPDVFGII